MGSTKLVYAGTITNGNGVVKLYDVHLGDTIYTRSSTGDWFVKVHSRNRRTGTAYFYWRLVTSERIKARLEHTVSAGIHG